MDDAIMEMVHQFALESSRNSTSEVTVGRPHPVELQYLTQNGTFQNALKCLI